MDVADQTIELPQEPEPPKEQWVHLEIFGHRQHYGRISEVTIAGAAMLRIDVPTADEGVFETHHYAGSAIFSMTPCTEAHARSWAERLRPRPYRPAERLPAPDHFDSADPDDDGFPI